MGIDGCRTGWVVATASTRQRPVQFTLAVSFTEVLTLVDLGRTVVCIDIPIGLPDSTSRRCDVEARRLLSPHRGSSIFPAPCRAALGGRDYRERCALNRTACGKALSVQTSNIVPKIREVDEAMTPGMQRWVHEAHPELAFTMAAGAPIRAPKHTADGLAERCAVLGRHGLACEPDEVRARLGRPGVTRDDIVDAAALLLTARRIHAAQAIVLGGDRDSRGLRMAITA